MPNIRDFVNGRNIVPLHSKDKNKQNNGLSPPPSPVEMEPEGNKILSIGKNLRSKVVSFYKLFRSYEQDQTNATICILLLPKYDEDNDVRDCLNYSIQA